MKRDDPLSSPTRPYRQTARAEAAEATARRIIRAFSDLLHSQWFDEVTLEEVARLGRVTVRTVIRRFGGKDGLLEAFVEQFVPSAAVSRIAARRC
jgi:AcrR family transcriptional regulator